MFERERLALDPGALETNRAGKISKGQRSKLRARATGAVIGLFGTSTFAAIAWWIAVNGARIWLAVALIATVAAPFAFWALGRIWADLRSGLVVTVTGIAVVTFEDEENHKIWGRLQGHRFSIPFAAAGILREPGRVTAYYTERSRMLVNLAPALANGEVGNP
jgi:hypothetical protein